MLILREALHDHSSDVREERKMLQGQLASLEQQIQPMEAMLKECEHLGKQSARRYVNSFFGIIFAQFMLTQYGTYVAFSWDIVEPVACIFTLSDSFLAYTFWLKTGSPWDIAALGRYFEARKQAKAIRKNYFDKERYD